MTIELYMCAPFQILKLYRVLCFISEGKSNEKRRKLSKIDTTSGKYNQIRSK